MTNATTKNRVRLTEITVLLQTVILGFVFGELWQFSSSIALLVNAYIESTSKQLVALVICLVAVIIGGLYFYFRGAYLEIKRLTQSWRIDLLAILIFGVFISINGGGVGEHIYKPYIAKIQTSQLILVILFPIILAILLICRAIFVIIRKKIIRDDVTPIFLNDYPIELKERDQLGLNDSALRFAQTVLNGGASQSLVFGIDAPWGVGKSSFINFCCEHWKNQKEIKIIVHRFEPLRYPESVDLTDKFVGDLLSTIQKYIFAPSIKPLFSKYAHLIKGKNDFSFLGIKFAFDAGSDTVEDTLENLEAVLSELDYKIVIVVDDLDRLSWSAIKNILFAIKRSFMLPNISYVLCYDTENIIGKDKITDDAEKVREFLEKFVNVKISLFLDPTALSKYVSGNFDETVKNNLQIDSRALDNISQAIAALVSIFSSDTFFQYQDLIGDIRKLKRLINTLVLLGVDKTDFENSDFNKYDLIHLLLIYLNYPNIFRKIFNTETKGRKGYFSLIRNCADASSHFKNSDHYRTYSEGLNVNQKFLLTKIFDVNAVLSTNHAESIDQGEYRYRACFNDDSNRNLERYLNLIVNFSKPEKRDSYKFYVKNKDAFIQGTTLDVIFSEEDFSLSKGDFARNNLWRVIVNSSGELSRDLGPNAVRYLMREIPSYSFLKGDEIGAESRKSLIYSLLKLLDSSAWGAELNSRRNNTIENILEIAEWIFAENAHINEGVIETLTLPERGVLGLYDLMIFRLYCSADRGSSFFNLQRALSIHSDPKALTSGDMTEIARQGMREISQSTFNIFNTQYIVPKKNIFEEFNKLSMQDLAGDSFDYVLTNIKKGNINQEQIDGLVAAEKSGMQSFVIYQLGNSIINSGIGCGYYDESGIENNKGIASKVNDYLFGYCFNPEVNLKNYEHFLDYLLTQFRHSFSFDEGVNYVSNIDEFTKVLEPKQLRVYWQSHRESIFERDFLSSKKKIITSGYIASYEEDLRSVYKTLDDFVKNE